VEGGGGGGCCGGGCVVVWMMVGRLCWLGMIDGCDNGVVEVEGSDMVLIWHMRYCDL
jgi:hypothetical protein